MFPGTGQPPSMYNRYVNVNNGPSGSVSMPRRMEAAYTVNRNLVYQPSTLQPRAPTFPSSDFQLNLRGTTLTFDPSRPVMSVTGHNQVAYYIQDCLTRDVTLRKQIRESNLATKRLRDSKASNLVTLTALRWVISALARIPDEILGLIFEFFVLDLGQSPWILTWVSRWFKKTAFETRRIWTQIHLAGRHSQYAGRYMNGRQRCLNLSDLNAALQRSRNASLDIKITDFSLAMARRLADEWERWGSLEIISPYNVNNQTNAVDMLFGIHKRKFGLQSVVLPELDNKLNNKLLYKWLETARPVSLHLNGCTDVVLNELSWWQELRELRLHSVGAGLVLRSINIQNTLTATPHLTHLEILNQHNHRCPIDSTMHFPQLVKLHLKRVEGWWHFRCEKLLELKLELKLVLQPPPNSTFSYPNLRNLDWDAYYDNLGVEMISAPQLESDTATGSTCCARDQPHLVKSQRNSFRFISKIPLVGRIFGIEQATRNQLAQAFTAKPTKKLPQPCANLRNITVCLLTDAKFDKNQYTQIFKTFIAMRRQTKPLKSLRVQWPNRDEWEEFPGTAAYRAQAETSDTDS